MRKPRPGQVSKGARKGAREKVAKAVHEPPVGGEKFPLRIAGGLDDEQLKEELAKKRAADAIADKVGEIIKRDSPRLLEPLAELKQEVARLSVRVARLESAGPRPTADSAEMPLPRRKGHALQGEKKHIRVRIDKELWRRVKDLADREFQGNEGLAVDCALWTFFGKPKLSFEISEISNKKAK